jgi:hypothetical protein
VAVKQIPSTIRSDEFQTIQRVFKDIAAESWLSRDPETVRKFAALLIRAYQSGTRDFETLHDFGLRTARERFAADHAVHKFPLLLNEGNRGQTPASTCRSVRQVVRCCSIYSASSTSTPASSSPPT